VCRRSIFKGLERDVSSASCSKAAVRLVPVRAAHGVLLTRTPWFLNLECCPRIIERWSNSRMRQRVLAPSAFGATTTRWARPPHLVVERFQADAPELISLNNLPSDLACRCWS
jgi:hypothetical protein